VETDAVSPRSTIRVAGHHAALVVIQRGLFVAGGVVFAAVVPRMMGPENYGRYALLTALVVFLAAFSGLGLTNAIGRYAPGFLHRGEMAQLHQLLGGLLTIRLVSTAGAAAVYVGVTVSWLHEVDTLVLTTMAITVLLQGLAQHLFSMFLGFDQAGYWVLGDTLRRWLSFALVVPGFALGGLRGASIALVAVELTLIAVGLRLSSVRLSLADLRISRAAFAPYVRFGVLFFANTALLTAFSVSGEPLIRLVSGSYVEVSYFALANNVFQAATAAVAQVPFALLPKLVRLAAGGATRDLARYVERLVAILTVVNVIAVFGVILMRDALVLTMFGSAYAPVARNLPPVMLALVMSSVSSVTLVVAVLHERPSLALRASLARLVVFWVAGPLCIAWWGGSFGACVAVLAASAVHAALSMYDLRDAIGTAVRSAALMAGAGALLFPLLWLRATTSINIILFAVFLVAYAAVLRRAGILRRENFQWAMHSRR